MTSMMDYDDQNGKQTWLKWQQDGRVAVYLDNLLLSKFMECEQKFKYRHVNSVVPKGSGLGAAASIGIWWAKTLELFYLGMKLYQQPAPGFVHPEAPSCDGIIQCAARAWAECQMEGEFKTKYEKDYDRFGGVEGAILMAQRYWETFGELDAKDWTIVSTEMSFGYGKEVLLFEDDSLLIYWCGRPDLVVYEKQNDQLLCVDNKSTKWLKSNFISKWKPHPQTAGYVKALQVLCKNLGYDRIVDRCMINGASQLVAQQPRKPGPRPRFLRPRPHYSPAEIAEWQKMTVWKCRALLTSYRSDSWTWRENACHLYAGCPYLGVCSVPPAARPVILQANYEQVEPWLPDQRDTEVEEEDGT